MMIGLRFLQGFGAGTCLLLAATVAADCFRGAKLVSVLGLLGAAWGQPPWSRRRSAASSPSSDPALGLRGARRLDCRSDSWWPRCCRKPFSESGVRRSTCGPRRAFWARRCDIEPSLPSRRCSVWSRRRRRCSGSSARSCTRSVLILLYDIRFHRARRRRCELPRGSDMQGDGPADHDAATGHRRIRGSGAGRSGHAGVRAIRRVVGVGDHRRRCAGIAQHRCPRPADEGAGDGCVLPERRFGDGFDQHVLLRVDHTGHGADGLAAQWSQAPLGWFYVAAAAGLVAVLMLASKHTSRTGAAA